MSLTFFSLEMSISLITSVMILYLLFVFGRLWNTGSILQEYDRAAAEGHLLSNGDPSMLRHLLGSGSAVAALLGQHVMNASLRVRPTVAVIVPTTYTESYTEEDLSSFTRDRLNQGLRLALMTGAPWLIVSGTTAECALAVAWVRAAMRGLALSNLFRTTKEHDAIWMSATPVALNASAASWDCLLRGPGAPSDLSTVGRVPLSFHRGIARDTAATAPFEEAKLSSFLEAHPRSSHALQSTRDLAAAVVAEHARGRGGSPTSGERGDDLEVFTGGRRHEKAFAPSGLFATDVDVADLWQFPRLWDAAGAHVCGFDANRKSGLAVSREASVPLMLPGIVTVPLDGLNPGEGAAATARAFRVLLEHSVLARKRLNPGDHKSWWLYNKSHGIIALSSSCDVQRVQLQYQTAFRQSRLEALEALQTTVALAAARANSLSPTTHVGKNHPGPSLLLLLPPFLLRPRSGRRFFGAIVGDWPAPVRHLPDLYVMQGAEVRGTQIAMPQPRLTSLRSYNAKLRILSGATEVSDNGETADQRGKSSRISLLDEGTPPPDASVLALTVGYYAHYIYYNYCRQRDAFLAGLFSVNYCDFFSSARDFASDLARGRIDWRDFFMPASR